MNNNKKGRPAVPVKKDQRITFRLSANELKALKAKLEKAGFKTPGAYVRENLCAQQPKEKVVVQMAAMKVALDLQQVANMINQGKDSSLVIEELHKINNKMLGV